jgi:predicted nucleotidyltransferase
MLTATGRTVNSVSLDDYARSRGFNFSEVAERLELESSDVAYVTGSILDGLGDAQSDLDLYVLTSQAGFERRQNSFASERKHQQERRHFGIIYLPVAGGEIDVECHPIQKFHDLFAALDSLNFTDPEQVQATFDSLGKYDRLEALELLHRLRIAKSFANKESFRAFRSLFHDDQFFRWNTHTCLIQVGEGQKEVKRSLKNEDYESAYLKLCRVFDVLIDAFLFSSRQSLDRWKWRLPKLRAAGRPDLLTRYLDVQMLRANGSEDLKRFIDDQLAASSLIQDEIKDRLK